MNGKRARAIRSITRNRAEYQAGKRHYHAIAVSAAQQTSALPRQVIPQTPRNMEKN